MSSSQQFWKNIENKHWKRGLLWQTLTVKRRTGKQRLRAEPVNINWCPGTSNANWDWGSGNINTTCCVDFKWVSLAKRGSISVTLE